MGNVEIKEKELGEKVDHRGDFNDIIGSEDKQDGRRRI